MCLKESCFPDSLKVLLVVPVFKNVGERSSAKNYQQVFEKLVNNRIADNVEECWALPKL